MTIFFKQNTATVLSVIFANAGTPVTGVTDAGVIGYVVKNGVTVAPITMTGILTELDSGNLPGVYTVTIGTGLVDVLGEVIFHFASNTASFDTYIAKGQVWPIDYNDIEFSLGAIQTDILTLGSDLVTLSGNVSSIDTKVDDILVDLDEIKGAGFVSSTDSLVEIRTLVASGGADLTPVLDSLDEIKGVGFVTADHSLFATKTLLDTVDMTTTSTLSTLGSVQSAVANVDLTVSSIDGKVDIIDVNVTSIEGKVDIIDANVDTALIDLTEIKGAGFNTATDSLEQIRDNIGSTDLTPVLTSLDEIKGAGFDTLTDSLVEIRDNAGSTDLTPVLTSLNEIKGTGFDTTTDALVSIADNVLRVLGLSQDNQTITAQTYDANGNLLSALVTIYPSKADTLAGTNAIGSYLINATYAVDNTLTSYRSTRES